MFSLISSLHFQTSNVKIHDQYLLQEICFHQDPMEEGLHVFHIDLVNDR